jgi:predicted amidohydrolase YtcJ
MAEGRLPLRLYCAIDGTGPLWDRCRERGPEIDAFDGRLTVRALKMYVDGALGSRGAALILPYSDAPDQRGLTVTAGEVLRSAAQECVARGFQMCVHAIGDRANAIALTVFENTFNDNGLNGADLRFRIEHAQVVDPGDAGRFRRAGIIPSMQPTHCTSDMPWAQERLGPERVRTAYAWRTLLDLQNEIPAGSDAPVESPAPLLGLYAAVTRQTPDGEPPGGWFPEQRMTRDEALRAFTLWAARAAFQEKVKGSLEEGKWADLVVLSDDIVKIPVEQIPRASVLVTMIGGAIVYSSGAIVPPLSETIPR